MNRKDRKLLKLVESYFCFYVENEGELHNKAAIKRVMREFKKLTKHHPIFKEGEKNE